MRLSVREVAFNLGAKSRDPEATQAESSPCSFENDSISARLSNRFRRGDRSGAERVNACVKRWEHMGRQ